jgi:hypothetical protein
LKNDVNKALSHVEYISNHKKTYIQMPVYIRTAAGRSAALNPLSLLPRSMRTLLTVIDGHSDSSVYQSRLPSLGDVQVLLDSLEKSGYIQIAYKATVSSKASSLGHALSSAPSLVVPWSDTHAGDIEPKESTPIVDTPAATSKYIEPHVAAATLDELSIIASAQHKAVPVQTTPSVIAPNLVPNNTIANSSQYKLRSAILLISDFVTLHMPAESIEIILTLEGLDTVEQLMASLNSYASLIAPLGNPAQQHLAQLKSALS